MRQLAREFPNVEFYLESHGENYGDWCIGLFKGDKYQIRYCEPPIDFWEDSAVGYWE